ncbi:MAG: hypothetical protein DWQ30_00660 [Acidobacteria bacterium]|nr:MAG: hypothetical protein DWQ30_00660 [Acidobacteriota bacterium]
MDDRAQRPSGTGDSSWPAVEAAVLRWLELCGEPASGALPRPSRQELDELCGPDPELRRRVVRLIEAWGGGDDLLSGDVGSGFGDLLDEIRGELEAEPRRGLVGQTIDRYRLVEVLGHGGMGVVYEAERADESFDKRVALKVMPRGLETPEKERRFRTERQVLARLEHPGIARLLDGGVTREGFPYLVMELVDGERIDRHCERRDLTLRRRVELFLDVCGAVHYAHQNLVIHRDLKPANVMVTAEGSVKLLDFGVAKVLDAPEDVDAAVATRFQPMTPRYAAPEQRQNRAVSTATDVYALGGLLGGLIEGAGGDRDAALRSEVGVVVARAMREDPAERFPSAAAMAEDLSRALRGRPLESRPSNWRYRLRRAVARHRRATAAIVLAVVLAVCGVTAVVWQSGVARQQRDRARLEAERTQQVSDLLSSLFASADPFSPAGGELTAEELLLRGAERVERELGEQPALRGTTLSVLAISLASLGEGERAWQLSGIAVDDLRSARPPDARALARALRVRATLALDLARREASPGALLDEAVALLRPSGLQDFETSVEWARIQLQLGRLATLAEESEAAVEHHLSGLETLTRLGLRTEAAIQRTYLASSLRQVGQDDQAVEHERHALAVLEQELGEDHPNIAATRNNLAVALTRQGRFAEAEALYRRALASSERTLGPDHAAGAPQLTNLGRTLVELGRFSEAEEPLRRAVAILRRSTGPDGLNRLGAEVNLARFAALDGDHDEAVASLRDALRRFERLSGDDSGVAARARALLAEALRRRGSENDASEAERLARAALAVQEAPERSAPPLARADTLTTLGRLAIARGAHREAAPLLRRALGLRRELFAEDAWQLAEVRLLLAEALLGGAGEGSPSQGAQEARELLGAVRSASLEDRRLADLERLRARLAQRIRSAGRRRRAARRRGPTLQGRADRLAADSVGGTHRLEPRWRFLAVRQLRGDDEAVVA